MLFDGSVKQRHDRTYCSTRCAAWISQLKSGMKGKTRRSGCSHDRQAANLS